MWMSMYSTLKCLLSPLESFYVKGLVVTLLSPTEVHHQLLGLTDVGEQQEAVLLTP